MTQNGKKRRSTADRGTKETFEVRIPAALLKRIRDFCDKHNLVLNEFVIDAMTEKMTLSYKERRKKPRL